MVFTAAAAAGESSRRIKEEEESGQTADREDADRRPETQSTDSGGDEQNEITQAIENLLLRSVLESMSDGTVDCSDSRLPSDGYVMNMYVISALLDHHWTHVNALVMRESQG